MTHRILASPIKEQRKSHTNTEVLDFFMKDDREYTSAELQEVGMLYEVRHFSEKYIQSKDYHKEIQNPHLNMGSPNATYMERTRVYFLTDVGRAIYTPTNAERKKSA